MSPLLVTDSYLSLTPYPCRFLIPDVKGGFKMKGKIHSIDSFSAVDGPGIRFVVFVQDCPMHCKFCHNPDTWACDAGRVVSVEEIMEQIIDAKPFFETSGGGVTISGGEPLMQPHFVRELLRQCKEQEIHTSIETSGFGSRNALEEILGYTDLVIFSLKAFWEKTQKKLSAANNRIILDNLRFIDSKDIPIHLQYLVIPSINDSDAEIKELAQFIASLHSVTDVELLPYHRLGVHKWEKLGLKYELEGITSPTPQQLEHIDALLQNGRLADMPASHQFASLHQHNGVRP
jgi:pyruvate formate lyase activating enzyme